MSLLATPATVPVGVQQNTSGSLVPIWRELPADLETPVSAYLKLAGGRIGFLLESVEGGERLARYSFVGSDPYLVLCIRGSEAEYSWLRGEKAGTVERAICRDPLAAVRAELERRPVAPIRPHSPTE